MFVTICDGYTLMKTSPSISFQSTLQQQLTQRTKYTCSNSRKGSTSCIIRTNNSLLNVSPSEVWDSYNAALVTDPLLVKSVTAGIILGAADFAGQAFENANSKNDDNSETKPVDYGRAARFALFGFVLQAPWNHYYYLLLDNQIPPTPTEPFSTTNIIKVLIDQFIQAPIFTVLIFVFLGLLEGKAIQSIQQQLENDYKDTIVANCTYKPKTKDISMEKRFTLLHLQYL